MYSRVAAAHRRTWQQLLAAAASVLAFFSMPEAGASPGPEVIVGPRSPVNPGGTGYHGQTIAAADPESDRDLLVCGFRTNPKTGSGYEGYVYHSGDGGRSWRETLVESGSQWVSETSCAYGLDHRAYFVALESDTSQGVPNHLMGTMRLFRSTDAGRTWQPDRVLNFLDYTSMVVDTTHGAWRSQLYLFANFARRSIAAGLDERDTLSTQPDFASRPFLARLTEALALRYTIAEGKFADGSGAGGGYFPTSSVVLSDGRVIAAFIGRNEHRATVFIAGISADGGETLAKSPIHETAAPASWPALAVNRKTDALIAAWLEQKSRAVDLMSATSADGGETWQDRRVILPAGTVIERGFGASVAVNAQGVVGFLWYGQHGGSAHLGLSYDGGRSIARVIDLTPPAAIASRGRSSSLDIDDRRLFVFPANWKESHGNAVRVLIRGPSPSGALLGTPALVTDERGGFHPIWTEPGNGSVHLWTRRIEIDPDVASSVDIRSSDLRDVSSLLICQITNTRYDSLGDLIAFDLAVTNRSDAAIGGPLFAVLESKAGELPFDVDNSDNGEQGAGARWQLSLPEERLRPGAHTEPRTLTLRMGKRANAFGFDVPLRIYGPGVTSR